MNHLLSIEDLDRAAIERIVEQADALRRGLRPRDQEGPGAARADGAEPLLRGLDAHAQLLRAGRQAAVRRRRELRRQRLERREGRVAEGHRADAQRAQARRDRDAHARGPAPPSWSRAGAARRSSTPATASTSTRRRRCSTSTRCSAASATLDGAVDLDRRRRRPLARRALEHPRLPADGREGHGRRPADADPARHRGARLRGALHARRAAERPTSSTRCGCSTSA